MNGWNDFQYNMAAGAGACGACYWVVPGANSGMSKDRKWESFASMQQGVTRAAMTPLQMFRGNYCTTAMNSFNTVGATDTCLGLDQLGPLPNTLVPVEAPAIAMYYPVTGGGGRFPTRCDKDDCTTVNRCGNRADRENCMVTVLDRYTSSFHWTELNFSAIWLRPQWYLVINSVISDVQNGGLSFVTGGDYTGSNFIPGQWMLARKNAFIGNTQQNNVLASNAGPFVLGGLACADGVTNRCYSKDEGISMPLSNFGNFQRLFSIYDGPAYQESNAYLDIKKTTITDCPGPNINQQCNSSSWMYGKVTGMRLDKDKLKEPCFLPNAAIGWKQPNGFYYPPAFHSTNLFFDNVDIRHFVIEPQFMPGTYKTLNQGGNFQNLMADYCTWTPTMFDNFSSVDRQTELSDDDGSLTGLKKPVSVNEDSYFNAAVEAIECRSDITAKTSPYDYITTVVYPDCAALGSTTSCLADPTQPWDSPCSDQNCYGVPLFRQFLTKGEQTGLDQEIRMAAMNLFQRSNLTVNNGVYYIDTSVGTSNQATGVNCQKVPVITIPVDCTNPVNIAKTVGDFPNNLVNPSPAALAQKACNCNLNVFRGGQIYYVFFLYAKAKPATRQTYQIYVGPGFNPDKDLMMARADIFHTSQLKLTTEDFPASPKGKWSRSYDSSILSVTVDLTDFEGEFLNTKADLCKPANFCTWNSGKSTCECNPALNIPSSPLYNPSLYKDCTETTGTGKRTICSWAGNDIDCPKDGCIGFSFKLPNGFQTDPAVNPRPVTNCFPKDTVWNIDYTSVDLALAGDCHNPNPTPLPTAFCQ
jgi:hypothetical protein